MFTSSRRVAAGRGCAANRSGHGFRPAPGCACAGHPVAAEPTCNDRSSAAPGPPVRRGGSRPGTPSSRSRSSPSHVRRCWVGNDLAWLRSWHCRSQSWIVRPLRALQSHAGGNAFCPASTGRSASCARRLSAPTSSFLTTSASHRSQSHPRRICSSFWKAGSIRAQRWLSANSTLRSGMVISTARISRTRFWTVWCSERIGLP